MSGKGEALFCRDLGMMEIGVKQGNPDQGCGERSLDSLIADPEPEHLFSGSFKAFERFKPALCLYCFVFQCHILSIAHI